MQRKLRESSVSGSETGGVKRRRKATDVDTGFHPVQQLQQQAGNQAVQELLHRQPAGKPGAPTESSTVNEVVHSPGQPLDDGIRKHFETRFGQDFSQVRVHSDARAAESAKSVSAQAYTLGNNVVFGAGQYAPQTDEGRKLVAHELSHIDQQANAASQTPVIHRKIEMRDVGKGEQSGFARLPELIDRLNALSQGLIFSVTGTELKYALKPGGTLNDFDRQMIAFIDENAVIPLRLTNRQGLLGDRATGFNDRVAADAWPSGYVDIDDLLGSTDLGLEIALVHFLRERTATANYERRIGSLPPNPNDPEFQRVHARGIDAEVQLLRDFFGDPSIRFAWEPQSGEIYRVYVNSRHDHIRLRVHSLSGAQQGVDRVSVEVLTRDGIVHTPEDYRRILNP